MAGHNRAATQLECDIMEIESLSFVYVAILLLIWAIYLGMRKRAEARSLMTRAEAFEAGLTEPASLHPKIDPALCLGCGACVRVCPEGQILGLVNGKAIFCGFRGPLMTERAFG